VERRPDPNDRRINRVFLTGKAAPIMDDMRAPAQDLYDMIVSGLSKA
jgi:DNA-binding MarR family transcriptional regulator